MQVKDDSKPNFLKFNGAYELTNILPLFLV